MIQVVLTAPEKLAYDLCGHLADHEQARTAAELHFVFVLGLSQTEAITRAEQVASAAQRARHKITEATQFEIVVADEETDDGQGA